MGVVFIGLQRLDQGEVRSNYFANTMTTGQDEQLF
jgi:hypothetical protein